MFLAGWVWWWCLFAIRLRAVDCKARCFWSLEIQLEGKTLRGLVQQLEFSRSWTVVQEGVNELEVITALDIPTVFKFRLKLMNAEESTMITDGSCISCLHSRRPSNPSRLWNVLLNQQRRGWRMLALLGSVTDSCLVKGIYNHWAQQALEAPPCLKTWKHPRL